MPALTDDLARVDGIKLEPAVMITSTGEAERDNAAYPPGSPAAFRRELQYREVDRPIALRPVQATDQVRPLFTSPEAYPPIKRQPIRVASNGHQEDHMTHGGTAVEGVDRGPAMNDLLARAYASAATDVDLVTIGVRHPAWKQEQDRLADLGLRRCPRCRKISPEDEFNTTGYCLCRKQGDNPYRPPSAIKHPGHRRPVSVERAGHPESPSADTRKGEREESRKATAVTSTPEPTPPPTRVHDAAEALRTIGPDISPQAEADLRKALDLPPRQRMEWRADVEITRQVPRTMEQMRSEYFELLCKLALDAKTYTRERDDLLDRIERNLALWDSTIERWTQ
jgi:hypothetical protein